MADDEVIDDELSVFEQPEKSFIVEDCEVNIVYFIFVIFL